MSTHACPINIGPRGRRQRRVVALAMLLVTAAGLVYLGTHDVARGWRTLLFFPLLLGALGYFQARAHT